MKSPFREPSESEEDFAAMLTVDQHANQFAVVFEAAQTLSRAIGALEKMKIKWTEDAIEAYKKTGEQMKSMGFKALREVKDPECHSVLTFWAGLDGCVLFSRPG